MNIVPSRANRMALPTLPSGSAVNCSEAAPPAGSLPVVYSPGGVTCTLSNSLVSASADDAATTRRTLLHRHQKFLPDVIAIVVGALAIQIGIGRPEESAEADFVYSVPLCHHDDLGGRYFAAFLVGLAEELALGRARLDAHPRARNHPCGQQIRSIKQARIAGLGLRQLFAVRRHQLLRAESAQ